MNNVHACGARAIQMHKRKPRGASANHGCVLIQSTRSLTARRNYGVQACGIFADLCPHELHRIEFRRNGRKQLHIQPRMPRQQSLDFLTGMNEMFVPHQLNPERSHSTDYPASVGLRTLIFEGSVGQIFKMHQRTHVQADIFAEAENFRRPHQRRGWLLRAPHLPKKCGNYLNQSEFWIVGYYCHYDKG